MNSLLGTEFESYDILSVGIVCAKTEGIKKLLSQALAELVFQEWESEEQYRESHTEVLAIANLLREVSGK